MTPPEQTQVLIIGAGIAGLTASLFLAHHNIRSILIERHTTPSIHPRARSVNARSMELFRHLGLTDRIRDAATPIANSGGMFHGSTLRDVIEARPRKDTKGKLKFAGWLGSTSPEDGTFVTQDCLEPVLVGEARARGGDVRMGVECLRVEQDDQGVTAYLRDRGSGEEYSTRAEYLIATDGAKSPIREQLGISRTGRGTLGQLLNILFEAPLKDFVQGREFSLCTIEQEDFIGILASINNDDRRVFHLHFDLAKGQKLEDYTPEACKSILHRAIGIPDLKIKVTSVMPCEPAVRIAESMRAGRIFLAGDAAHQMPPYAGQGANSAIADVHNLAWKLAAVLHGQASADLLSTYEAERLQAGKAAAEVSASGCDERGLLPMKKNLAFFRSMWPKLFVVAGFGYGYGSAAICREDVGPLGGLTWRPWSIPSLMFALDGQPGRRVPHVWVERDGERVSTLDVCGRTSVLLAGANGEKWASAARQLSKSMEIDIVPYTTGSDGDLRAASGVFEAAAGISLDGALLVRPDDFVAWRSRRGVEDYMGCLEDIMKQILHC